MKWDQLQEKLEKPKQRMRDEEHYHQLTITS